MTDLEFNISPPEEVQRDEFNRTLPTRSEEKEAPHRSKAKNRALVQAVSAAAAVVIVGNSLGIDYLGDFFGLTPITSVLETEGTAIPSEYAEYLDYLITLCASGAEDYAISREINGEVAYKVAGYFSDMGYDDMYYCRGRLHSGVPSALVTDPVLYLGLEEEYTIGLVYIEKAGSATSSEGGAVRCVQTGVYGTAGSVTHAYIGDAHIDAEAMRLVPTTGSYTRYEGSSPEITLVGDYLIVEDPEYAKALDWYYIQPCYLENGVISLRFDPSAPSLEVKDGILGEKSAVSIEKNGEGVRLSVFGMSWRSAWRGSVEDSFYHTALQEAGCFSYHITGRPDEDDGFYVPDEYREVYDRIFALAQSGAEDDAFIAEMTAPIYAEAVNWWALNAPGFWYDGSAFEREPGDHPVMLLGDVSVNYLENGSLGAYGAECVTFVAPGGYDNYFSFRGIMDGYGRYPVSGVYHGKNDAVENILDGEFAVEGVVDNPDIKTFFLYNGIVSLYREAGFSFTGEAHDGYLKFDDALYGAEVFKDSDTGEWTLDVWTPEASHFELARGSYIGSALMFTRITETVIVADDGYATPPSDASWFDTEVVISDEVKSAMDALIAASRAFMEDDSDYPAYSAVLRTAAKAVRDANLQSSFAAAWYVDGRLEGAPSSGEAVKLSTNIYKDSLTYVSDASALYSGTEGVMVYDTESSAYFFTGSLKAESSFDEYGSLVNGTYVERYSWDGTPQEMTRMTGVFVYDSDGAYLHSGTVTSESLGGAALSVSDGSLELGGRVTATLGKTSWSGDDTVFSVSYQKDDSNSYSNTTTQLRGDTLAENLYHSFIQKVSGFYTSYSYSG